MMARHDGIYALVTLVLAVTVVALSCGAPTTYAGTPTHCDANKVRPERTLAEDSVPAPNLSPARGLVVGHTVEEHNATTDPAGWYTTGTTHGTVVVRGITAVLAGCTVTGHLYALGNASVHLNTTYVWGMVVAADTASVVALNGTRLATNGTTDTHNVTTVDSAHFACMDNVSVNGPLVATNSSAVTIGSNVTLGGLWVNGTATIGVCEDAVGIHVSTYTIPVAGTAPTSVYIQGAGAVTLWGRPGTNITLSGRTYLTAGGFLNSSWVAYGDGLVVMYYPLVAATGVWVNGSVYAVNCTFSGTVWDSGGGSPPRGPVDIRGGPRLVNFSQCVIAGALNVMGNSSHIDLRHCTLQGLHMDRSPWVYAAEARLYDCTVTNASMGALGAVYLSNETRCILSRCNITGDAVTRHRTNLTASDCSFNGSIVLREGSSVDSVQGSTVSGNITVFIRGVLRIDSTTQVSGPIYGYHNATIVSYGGPPQCSALILTNDALACAYVTHTSWSRAVTGPTVLNITALDGAGGIAAFVTVYVDNILLVDAATPDPSGHFVLEIDPVGIGSRGAIWRVDPTDNVTHRAISTHFWVQDVAPAPAGEGGRYWEPPPTGRTPRGRAPHPPAEAAPRREGLAEWWARWWARNDWYVVLTVVWAVVVWTLAWRTGLWRPARIFSPRGLFATGLLVIATVMWWPGIPAYDPYTAQWTWWANTWPYDYLGYVVSAMR